MGRAFWLLPKVKCMLSRALIATSAILMSIMGLVHLFATFSPLLTPRNPDVTAAMRGTPLVLTQAVTMWNAWVGFNCVMSLGLLLFGVIYGYFAVFRFEILLQAQFILWAGIIYLAGAVALAQLYFFKGPVIGFGVCLATLLIGSLLAIR
jgi:hypothetical protein